MSEPESRESAMRADNGRKNPHWDFVATVRKDGTITIPKRLRDELGIQGGAGIGVNISNPTY